MNLPNPDIKFAKGKGIDLPIMTCYLAGRIAGNCMEKCTSWRKEIREHYKNYKQSTTLEGFESYPISFIDPLNSGETKTADALGLKSHIPSNLIYDKDLLSVERADVIVANVEDYFEVGIEKELDFIKNLNPSNPNFNSLIIDEKYFPINTENAYALANAYIKLVDHIKNRRENFGTICEIAWALYLQKPLILIVPEARAYIYENHPFAKRASVIVKSTEQLLKEKWLEILYKSIAGATY